MCAQEVDAYDGEGHVGEEKRPRETAAGELDGGAGLPPARDAAPCGAGEERTGRRQRGGVGDDAEGGTGVDEVTPGRGLILHEDEEPGGDGVEPRRAL
jgi:hypothetical protein